MNREPLPVCVVTTSYPRRQGDDAGIFVERLVEAFGTCGLTGTVVVPRDADEAMEETRGAFLVKRFGYGLFRRGKLAFGAGIVPNLRRNKLLILQIPGLLLAMSWSVFRQRRARVVHANWIVCALGAYPACAVLRKPLVVTCRGEDAKLLNLPLVGFLLRRVLARCAAIVTVSESLKERVCEAGVPADRVTVIANGVAGMEPLPEELLSWCERRELHPGHTYVLFVGRIIPLKRVEWAIDLVSEPSTCEARLLLCGRAEDAEYRSTLDNRIFEKDIGEKVRFCGPVPPAEVGRYLSVARYFVNFSESEGRPNAVLEALSFGKIVLLSDIPAHREIVTHGVNGFIVTDPSEAARIVSDLERDEGLYLAVAAAARQSVAGLSWERAAQSYRELFEAVV